MDEQAQTPPTEPLTHTGYLGRSEAASFPSPSTLTSHPVISPQQQ